MQSSNSRPLVLNSTQHVGRGGADATEITRRPARKNRPGPAILLIAHWGNKRNESCRRAHERRRRRRRSVFDQRRRMHRQKPIPPGCATNSGGARRFMTEAVLYDEISRAHVANSPRARCAARSDILNCGGCQPLEFSDQPAGQLRLRRSAPITPAAAPLQELGRGGV